MHKLLSLWWSEDYGCRRNILRLPQPPLWQSRPLATPGLQRRRRHSKKHHRRSLTMAADIAKAALSHAPSPPPPPPTPPPPSHRLANFSCSNTRFMYVNTSVLINIHRKFEFDFILLFNIFFCFYTWNLELGSIALWQWLRFWLSLLNLWCSRPMHCVGNLNKIIFTFYLSD